MTISQRPPSQFAEGVSREAPISLRGAGRVTPGTLSASIKLTRFSWLAMVRRVPSGEIRSFRSSYPGQSRPAGARFLLVPPWGRSPGETPQDALFIRPQQSERAPIRRPDRPVPAMRQSRCCAIGGPNGTRDAAGAAYHILPIRRHSRNRAHSFLYPGSAGPVRVNPPCPACSDCASRRPYSGQSLPVIPDGLSLRAFREDFWSAD